MKKAGWSLLFLLWAGAGCVTLPTTWSDEKKEPTPVPVASPTVQPVAPVTADQVNETNAREKASALQAELDRDDKPAK